MAGQPVIPTVQPAAWPAAGDARAADPMLGGRLRRTWGFELRPASDDPAPEGEGIRRPAGPRDTGDAGGTRNPGDIGDPRHDGSGRFDPDGHAGGHHGPYESRTDDRETGGTGGLRCDAVLAGRWACWSIARLEDVRPGPDGWAVSVAEKLDEIDRLADSPDPAAEAYLRLLLVRRPVPADPADGTACPCECDFRFEHARGSLAGALEHRELWFDGRRVEVHKSEAVQRLETAALRRLHGRRFPPAVDGAGGSLLQAAG